MKIGCGITTTSKRPYHQQYWDKLVMGKLFDNVNEIHFAHGFDGVAKAKNDCLRKLRDSDVVFLFDDDTFPIKEGWEKLFIDAYNTRGIHHFSYLHNFQHIRKLSGENGISIYNNSAGCMMFLTKDVIERVGAYDEGFGRYGYEHAQYSERIRLAGLAPARNICPDAAPEFIYSMDLDSWKKFDFKHCSTLSPDEMIEAEKKASEHLSIQNETIYLPL